MAAQTLFDIFDDDERARARRTDPDTSHEAAESVNVTRGQQLVLQALEGGPATDEMIYFRIVRHHKTTPSGVRGFRVRLQRKGLVKLYAENGVTSAGKRCQIWAVNETQNGDADGLNSPRLEKEC